MKNETSKGKYNCKNESVPFFAGQSDASVRTVKKLRKAGFYVRTFRVQGLAEPQVRIGNRTYDGSTEILKLAEGALSGTSVIDQSVDL